MEHATQDFDQMAPLYKITGVIDRYLFDLLETVDAFFKMHNVDISPPRVMRHLKLVRNLRYSI